MKRSLPPLNSLRAFEAAARHLSISAAAEELCVSRGAVSQQVISLEERLGVSLMNRTTRKIELTQAGEQLYASARRAFDDIANTAQAVVERQRRPSIKVSVSTYFSARWLSPRLGRFWDIHPDVQLLFQHDSDSDRVDTEEAEIAIRWGFGDWDGASVVAKLFDAPMSVYCAPSFFAEPKKTPTWDDLKDVVLLTDKEEAWRKWFEQAGLQNPNFSNSRYIKDAMFRVQAAIDRNGILLGDHLLQNELSSGQLVRPFEAEVPDCGFYLVARHARAMSRDATAFCDWLIEEAHDA